VVCVDRAFGVGDIVQRAQTVTGRSGAIIDMRSFYRLFDSERGRKVYDVPGTELK
jgi:hypothetical protein